MNSTLAIVLTCSAFCFGVDADGSPNDPQKAVSKPGAPRIMQVAQNAAPMDENPPGETTQPAKLSDAERAARLKRGIDAAQKELEKIKQDEESPESEYRNAENEYQMLDVKWTEHKKAIQTLTDAGKVQEAELLQGEQKSLKRQWDSAKERFELVFQERKTLREKAAALRTKIQQDQEALEKLTGKAPPDAEAPDGPPGKEPANPDIKKEPTTTPKVAQPANPGAAPTTKDGQPAAQKTPAPTGQPEAKGEPTKAAPEPKRAPQLVKAQEEAKAKEAAATEAKDKAKNIAERIEALRKNIAVEQSLLESARKKTEQARKSLDSIEQEINKSVAGDPTKLAELSQQKAEAAERVASAQAAIYGSQDRLNELRAELNSLLQDQIAALRESDQKRRDADQAQRKVDSLQNPFTVHNLMQWTLNHGPSLLAILIGAIILHLVMRTCSRRIAAVIAHSGGRGTDKDQENRSLTLLGVFRSTGVLLILGGGTFMVLDEIGIPIMPLMGGAAVLGLAVAFGAQNLIRDYFSGFMVLMEDQYGINDVVKIGDIAGVVEKITLRMTVLRDLEGVVHFIPHGTITRVSNMTHGWSRALFSIGIAYREDPRRVMQILLELAKEMRSDPVFGPNILEDPEMLGVDQFSESSVVIKFFLKTKPLQQWPIRRELLLRIKRKFDELGIEIPFPHRTIYHHHEREETSADSAPRQRREAGAAA